MNVELISHTSNPEMIVAAAAKLCYSDKEATQLLDNLTPDAIDKFIAKLSGMGHLSPFEHVSYTFSISGVSRTLLAQITRHRIASYSVRSQRYVNESNFGIVVPPAIMNNKRAYDIFQSTIANIRDAYTDICDILLDDMTTGDEDKKTQNALKKIAQEDARYILPNATMTNMVVTMNTRSLLNFFELRCCEKAQWEIRDLAYKMLKLCYDVSPNLFKYAGPSCYNGHCREGAMSCGKPDKAKSKGDCIRGIGC